MNRNSWRSGEGRTPLFKALRHALQLARWANQPNAPSVNELVEMQQAALLTRRRLIKNSGKAILFLGGTGLVTALGERSHARSKAGPQIVIVGAGIAGLNTAYRLKQAGYYADVYEAAHRIGGRMYTVKDILGAGLTTNLGGEFVDSNHLEIQALAKEFGVELLNRDALSESLLRTSYFFDGNNYTETEIIEAFRPLATKIQTDYSSIGNEGKVDFQHEANAGALDHISIAEYLQKNEVTGWLKKLLDVAYQTEYGLDTDRQSSLNLITLIGTDLTQGFKLFGDSNERYLIKGGSQVIVDELAKRLPKEIKLEHRLEAVKSNGNKFTLTFAKPNSVVDIDADFVVMTIPFSVLQNVNLKVEMPPVKLKAIKELGYGTNAKVVIGFNNRFWRYQGFNGEVFTDLEFQMSWDNTQLQPGQTGGITFFSGGTPGLNVKIGTDRAQADHLMLGMEKVFPGISATRNGKVSRFDWPSYPLTLGSYSCYLPGQWTTIANSQIVPVGNMFFAGEHCSYSFQGYMNGGAETGKRAAGSLLAVLGKSRLVPR